MTSEPLPISEPIETTKWGERHPLAHEYLTYLFSLSLGATPGVFLYCFITLSIAGRQLSQEFIIGAMGAVVVVLQVGILLGVIIGQLSLHLYRTNNKNP